MGADRDVIQNVGDIEIIYKHACITMCTLRALNIAVILLCFRSLGFNTHRIHHVKIVK